MGLFNFLLGKPHNTSKRFGWRRHAIEIRRPNSGVVFAEISRNYFFIWQNSAPGLGPGYKFQTW